jgi:ATP-binding cassette subfamily B protein
MWNRQREAQEAREKLALAAEGPSAPNRNPPPIDDEVAPADAVGLARADAAE